MLERLYYKKKAPKIFYKVYLMKSLFEKYNHLGFFNPFVFKNKGSFEIGKDFDSVLNLSEKKIDHASVAQIMSYGFSLGNRTLIGDVFKSPWMAKPNNSNSDWEYFKVPSHNEHTVSIEEISKDFFNRLKIELFSYIKDKSNIGFLLTGGMDSRIVASVLSNVIKEHNLENVSIYTYTWGDPKSRDVVYAEKIAKLYNWNWEHLIIDKKQLERNIDLTIENACEFSPIHLHAMPQVSGYKHLDCLIAGSFGDSIGRGEYSGVKVQNLKPLKKDSKNSLNFLNKQIFNNAVIKTEEDIENYHQIFPQEKNYQQLEQDYQLHYMRRMLNPCFNVINKKLPVYQMFSSPEVFGYMWSLHPSLRTDDVYYNILKDFSPELLAIPWARTGLPFLQKKGNPDKFNNKTIDYGALIRGNFLDKIEKTLLGGSLVNSNTISLNKIKKTIQLIRSMPIKESYYFEDKLIWLYSLQIFIDRNEIKLENYTPNFASNYLLYKEYFLRLSLYRYRKKIKKILRNF